MSTVFIHIAALIRKELQEQLRTTRNIMVLFFPIVMQCILFPFMVTMDVTDCPAAILNEDGGAASLELVQRIQAAPYITRTVRVDGAAQLQECIDSQDVMIGVHIPADFSRRLARAENADVQVVCDGRRSNSSQIAAGYITSIASQMTAERSGANTAQTLTVRNLYNPVLDPKWFILPCLFGLLGMLTTLNISCMGIAKEREAGTYEQLCVTPMSRFELLIGKTVPAVLLVLGQAVIILLMARYAFGVPLHGSVPALFVVVGMYSMSLAGIGCAISSCCSTQQQAYIGMFCFIIPALLISGFVSPIENMPPLLQYVAYIDPLYYLFTATRGIFLKAYSFQDILSPHLTAFAIIGSFYLIIAYLLLRLKKD